jgi:ABC-type nitrate/sulfonate/bicarbonate transport system ATPase subunit
MYLIGLVGLCEFEERYPRELSEGMQQRVALCRALTHNPSVLLMDEPFAGLDAMTREELGFGLMCIRDADNKTVIFVTHNITEVILRRTAWSRCHRGRGGLPASWTLRCRGRAPSTSNLRR